MMASRHYTREQLLKLRESPLVQKPDKLPAIEQWMDEAQPPPQKENNAARQRQQRAGLSATGAGGEGSPMGSFSTGQRPSLMQMRSKTGDDLTLGPPRTMFPSSRNTPKLGDTHERTSSIGDINSGEEQDSVRSRFFADRQLNRKSGANDKEGGENRNSWTSARDRRATGDHEDHKGEGRERGDRNARHDRDHDADRRNGQSDRYEGRWGSARDDKRQNGDRPGGWREREQQRRDRDAYRGQEKDPEWMDDPVVQKEKDLGMRAPKTAEEFEKWKEAMRKGGKSQTEPEPESVDNPPAPIVSPSAEPKPALAPLKLEGFEGGMFGGWGGGSAGGTAQAASSSAAKPAAAAKTSRFASMFKPAEEPAPVEEVKQKPPADHPNKTSAEEREGFDRVLAMLGGTKSGAAPLFAQAMPTSPPPRGASVGVNGDGRKPKSRFFGAKDPETVQSPVHGSVTPGMEIPADYHSRGPPEGMGNAFGGRLPERHTSEQHVPRVSVMESAPQSESAGPFNAFREQQPRPSSGRLNEMAFEPPARRTATPDDNIQNLLAQQRQKQQATSNESQALLNLLIKSSSGSRPSTQQSLPNNAGIDASQLQRWLESQQSSAPAETHAPKPRMPQPPGMFEEQLMRNYSSEQPRHDQRPQMQSAPPPPDMLQRRISQRMYEDAVYNSQQQPPQQQQLRRAFTEGPPQQMQHAPPPPMPQPDRRMSGHPNMPPMHGPGSNQPPAGYQDVVSPGAGSGGIPPPGFNPHMPRHPPGLNNIPNIFQAPQQREPPPPGFGGMQSPPANPPPGFFGGPQGMPPGFMPQGQGMRSPADGLPLRGANAAGRPYDGGYANMR